MSVGQLTVLEIDVSMKRCAALSGEPRSAELLEQVAQISANWFKRHMRTSDDWSRAA